MQATIRITNLEVTLEQFHKINALPNDTYAKLVEISNKCGNIIDVQSGIGLTAILTANRRRRGVA